MLLQIFYSIRSERLLVEQLDYNFLFRWFVGFSVDEPVWDHSTFSRNRERLLVSEAAVVFFHEVLEQARSAGLVSDEHFSVDVTLIEAWASMKSFRRKDEGDGGDSGEGAAARAGIFVVRGVVTSPMNRRAMRMRGCTARARGTRRVCATWDMC